MESVLGKTISVRSRELGYSQRELAKKVGVTEATMSRYIHGSRMPKQKVLVTLAKVLGTSTEELIGNKKRLTFKAKAVRVSTKTHQATKGNRQVIKVAKEPSTYREIKKLVMKNSAKFTSDERLELIKLLSMDAN